MNNNVYIAGSWINRIEVKNLMSSIESWGYNISVDWTNHVGKDKLVEYVQEYMKGIKECDYFVYCMDGIKSIGKNFELGYATALDKKIGIYLFSNKTFGPNMETTPLNKIMNKECAFVRANIYQMIHTIEELKNWLTTISPQLPVEQLNIPQLSI